MGEVANDIYIFATKTINAHTDSDLDAAATAFSRAVVLAGVTVIMALLLRRSVKQIQATRGSGLIDAIRPRIKPGLPAVGSDPAAGMLWSRPTIASNPRMLPGYGATTAFGDVEISSNGSVTEQALARAHEMVHQFSLRASACFGRFVFRSE